MEKKEIKSIENVSLLSVKLDTQKDKDLKLIANDFPMGTVKKELRNWIILKELDNIQDLLLMMLVYK